MLQRPEGYIQVSSINHEKNEQLKQIVSGKFFIQYFRKKWVKW